jgi:hypothetical protein
MTNYKLVLQRETCCTLRANASKVIVAMTRDEMSDMSLEVGGLMKRRRVVMLPQTDIAHKRVVMGIFVDGEQLLDIRE